MDEVTEKKKNPLLDKLHKIPGNTYRLPSRGMFYRNGEIDPTVEDGEVEVHSMTAADELMMKSPDMLFQGTAVTRVIERCVPQVLKAGNLLVPDVDYLLTCIRRVSFGPTIVVPHRCPHCESPKELDYIVPLDHFIRQTKELTEEEFKNMKILLNDMYEVRMRPCEFLQMVKIIQMGDKLNSDSSAEEVDGWLCQSLAAVIKSVDGVTDTENIREWAAALPLAMRHELSDKITSLNQWGPDFKYATKCHTCKKNIELVTSINPTNFFTQSSS